MPDNLKDDLEEVGEDTTEEARRELEEDRTPDGE